MVTHRTLRKCPLRIDHASPTKENGNPKKSSVLSAGEKYMELTETSTVEKKAEKAREIACANHVTKPS